MIFDTYYETMIIIKTIFKIDINNIINWVKKKFKNCNQFKYQLNGNYQVLKNISSLIGNILYFIKNLKFKQK